MNSEAISGRYSGRQFRILGVCWLTYGALAIVFGFWLVSFQNNATMMFGALLSRVADPFTLMDEFHVLYEAAIVLAAVCGVLGILAGWALLANLRVAGIAVVAAAIVSLPQMPLGTTLGIFSLILLLLSSRGGAEATRQVQAASHPENAPSWRGAAKSG